MINLKKYSLSSRQYFLLAVSNLFIIFLGQILYPDQIVVGNDSTTFYFGLLIAAALFLMFQYLSLLITKTTQVRKYKSEALNLLLMAGVNTAGVWLTGRFSSMTGLGISSYLIAVILGIFLTAAVYLVKRSN